MTNFRNKIKERRKGLSRKRPKVFPYQFRKDDEEEEEVNCYTFALSYSFPWEWDKCVAEKKGSLFKASSKTTREGNKVNTFLFISPRSISLFMIQHNSPHLYLSCEEKSREILHNVILMDCPKRWTLIFYYWTEWMPSFIKRDLQYILHNNNELPNIVKKYFTWP